MTKQTLEAIRSLICSREELALNRLKNNSQYSSICEQQDNTQKIVEKLYEQFKEEERIAIRRHYEGENRKIAFEIYEIYMQGLRDCYRLITFLNAR